MTDNELTNKLVKAASAGLATTFALMGFPKEHIKKATILYAHQNGGLLSKRAALRNQFAAKLLAKIGKK